MESPNWCIVNSLALTLAKGKIKVKDGWSATQWEKAESSSDEGPGSSGPDSNAFGGQTGNAHL